MGELLFHKPSPNRFVKVKLTTQEGGRPVDASLPTMTARTSSRSGRQNVGRIGEQPHGMPFLAGLSLSSFFLVSSARLS